MKRIILSPYPWDLVVAGWTATVMHVIFQYLEMYAMDQAFFAAGAECGIVRMAWDIADSNIIQARVFCNLIGLFKGFYWCGREIGKLVRRRKP